MFVFPLSLSNPYENPINVTNLYLGKDTINYEENIIFENNALVYSYIIANLGDAYFTYEAIPNYGERNVLICYGNIATATILDNYKSYFYTYKSNGQIGIRTRVERFMFIKCINGIYNGTDKICIGQYFIYTEDNKINIKHSNIKGLTLFKYL